MTLTLPSPRPGSAAAPFRLGPFEVDPGGRLSPAPDRVPSFSVLWRERTIHVRVEDPTDEPLAACALLTLRTILGRVPSTAKDEPERALARRDALFQSLRLLPSLLPNGWQLHVQPDHRIGLEMPYRLPLPATAVELVTALVVALMRLQPFLDVLDEDGCEPAAPRLAA